VARVEGDHLPARRVDRDHHLVVGEHAAPLPLGQADQDRPPAAQLVLEVDQLGRDQERGQVVGPGERAQPPGRQAALRHRPDLSHQPLGRGTGPVRDDHRDRRRPAP